MGVQSFPLPQLGPQAGINLDVPLLACHPETLKPVEKTNVQDGSGNPVFKCVDTGVVGGGPSEFWAFILPLLGWVETVSEGGRLVKVPKIPEDARLKFTIEIMNEETPDSSEETESGSIILP